MPSLSTYMQQFKNYSQALTNALRSALPLSLPRPTTTDIKGTVARQIDGLTCPIDVYRGPLPALPQVIEPCAQRALTTELRLKGAVKFYEVGNKLFERQNPAAYNDLIHLQRALLNIKTRQLNPTEIEIIARLVQSSDPKVIDFLQHHFFTLSTNIILKYPQSNLSGSLRDQSLNLFRLSVRAKFGLRHLFEEPERPRFMQRAVELATGMYGALAKADGFDILDDLIPNHTEAGLRRALHNRKSTAARWMNQLWHLSAGQFIANASKNQKS